jgi:N-acyl-L-homoserine lactone synthetase
MSKIVNQEYINKVNQLSEEEVERLLSRMSGKLPKRLHKEKLTKEEALALQLEIEDEQLEEWRKTVAKLK